MKFLDEFRDPDLARRLVRQIKSKATQRWVVMDVCGGQTHSLLRHGIDTELEDVVELIHGPGCPVCVTDIAAIDLAQKLASQSGFVLMSFGDMLRVPGTAGSLLTARAAGANVMTVYSPLDAVSYAEHHPDAEVVFFAVGFETTIPSTALAIRQAQQLGLTNFSVLASHVRVLPAMETLMQMPNNRVQAFLAAGHVCVITGSGVYDDFVRRHQIPVVVTGFEPVDLLHGILECVNQLESNDFRVHNSYGRSVNRTGNVSAQMWIDSVYEVVDQTWRGLGVIPEGGYQIANSYGQFDALRRFAHLLTKKEQAESHNLMSQRCKAGLVMSGQLRPCDCPEFGTTCTPDSPLGSPMVSSEGACAAYFRYRPSVGNESQKPAESKGIST